MVSVRRKGVLTAQDIQAAVDAAGLELARAGIEEKLCIPFRLALEEILLLYQNKLGEGAPYTLSCNKRRGDLNVRLSVAGESLDPFSQGDIIVKKLGRQFRNDPLWEYKGSHGNTPGTAGASWPFP